MTSVLRRFAVRVGGELLTLRGRRRLRRRVASRLLLFFVVAVWVYPSLTSFWDGQLANFVAGRVSVSGGEPFVRTSVVFVPAPADPADVTRLRQYAVVTDGLEPPPVRLPEDGAVQFWTDVDGRFGGMHVRQALPYRVEVRRRGCETVSFGVRRFWLPAFWSRRLHLEVPPCPGSCY